MRFQTARPASWQSCMSCGKEVLETGQQGTPVPVAKGWLRVSHRKLDKKLTTQFRPYHTHDEKQPLEPGKVYDLDIEVIPTSIVVPKTSGSPNAASSASRSSISMCIMAMEPRKFLRTTRRF